MSSELKATQVNLLRHQRTKIPPNNSKWKQFYNKSRLKNVGYAGEANQQQVLYKEKFNPRQILNSDDRCHKCRDFKHIEWLQGSAHKYQCRNCHIIYHLSSLCYKKQESFKNANSRSHKAHQLRLGQVYLPDSSICSQLGDNASSYESFCLQRKSQAKQADTIMPCSEYQLLFKDPDCIKLALSDLQ